MTTASLPSTDAGNEVRFVKPSEYKAAAACLAEAFEDDYVARYFLDTPDRKRWSETRKSKLHTEIMEYLTLYHIYQGQAMTAGPSFDCVALWMFPGQDLEYDYRSVWRSGLWRLYYKLSVEGRKRFFSEFFPLLDSTKESVLGTRNEESYYLVYIGTRPSGRGKGYAKACIEHVTKHADIEGRPCYLESSHPENIGIYRKFGFELVQQISMTRGERAVELDIMLREPAGSTPNSQSSTSSRTSSANMKLAKAMTSEEPNQETPPVIKMPAQVTAQGKNHK